MQVMVIANRKVNTCDLLRVILNGHIASIASTMKYLGLHINSAFNWNGQIERIRKKVLLLIWNFAKIRHLIDLPTSRYTIPP